MRPPIIAANWKMNKTISQGIQFVNDIKDKVAGTDVEMVLCAPFIMLSELKKVTAGTNIKIGAQNMHLQESGAFTGEISPVMLKDVGVDYVIIGHSERRELFNETDDVVNAKVIRAVESRIIPIMCCGETLEEREAGQTKEIVKKQVMLGLMDLPREEVGNMVIAYEPIWAIGTGKTSSSEDANQVIAYIRETVKELYDDAVSEKIRIQYGGSVKPSNVKTIMGESDIDGALVGGASLDAESYIGLVNF